MIPVTIDRAHPQLRGCIAWWPCLDGSGNRLVDVIGQQHGTFGAGAASPTWAPGRDGTAILFDGGDNVDCGSDARFDALAAFTITAWVNVRSLAARHTILTGDEASGTTPSFNFRILETTGMLNLTADTSAGNAFTSGTTEAIVVGEWAHVAARYNGATLAVYKNAIQDATTAAQTGTTDAVDGKVRVGAWSASGTLTHNANAFIGDVRMFDRALTAAEIRDIYLDPWAPFVGGLPICN